MGKVCLFSFLSFAAAVVVLLSCENVVLSASTTAAFVSFPKTRISSSTTRTKVMMSTSSIYRSGTSSKSSKNYYKSYGKNRQNSKRQERVSHLVRSEISKILHTGNIKGEVNDVLEDELRQRISVVDVDISPDLKQARVSVSIRGGSSGISPAGSAGAKQEDDDYQYSDLEDGMDLHDPVVDKRRAYSWLVRNSKPIRHTLAQRMSHMKTSPNLTFVQVDVAAAVDVMYLIDKVAAGYKREKIGSYGENTRPTGVFQGIDFDEEYDDEEWDEDDDGNFF